MRPISTGALTMNFHDLSQFDAAPGTIWVCAACGRVGTNRAKLGDTSCFLHAVLCQTESLIVGEDGRSMSAVAVGVIKDIEVEVSLTP